MNYRAVVLDIDGTLVPVGTAGVSPRVVRAVNAVRRQGVLVAVATGRSSFVLTPALLGDFTADYYVCVNGSLITDQTRTAVREERLSLAQMEALNRFADEQDVVLAYTFEDNYYFYRGYRKFLNNRGAHYVGDGADDGWATDCPTRDRHLESMPYGAVLHLLDSQQAEPPCDDLCFVRFAPGSYDVYRRDIDKARGVQTLLESRGISMAQCVAIGDGNNDVPLLRAAGLGVAMGNARPAAAAAADVMTDTVEQDGVAAALERLFHI